MSKIIIYDFDGTLTPYPITDFKILEKCGYIGGGNNKDLKEIVKDKMDKNKINVYQAFYQTIFEILKYNNYELKDEIVSFGSEEIIYNNGVYDYLNNIENKVENYIVSSGMKIFLEKTTISKFFNNIYATTFKYDENDIIIDIDYLMTDEKKVDVIKEIVKDRSYKDVIYIGDGLTDLKAMDYVKKNGGISIYLIENNNDIKDNNSVSYYFLKDYSKNSNLRKFIYNLCEIKNTQK